MGHETIRVERDWIVSIHAVLGKQSVFDSESDGEPLESFMWKSDKI